MRSLVFSLIFLLLACSSGTQMGVQAGKMIVPGVGTDEVQVGMRKAEIIDLLGEPQAVENQGQILEYGKDYGLSIFLGNEERVAEIRFGEGFRGRLPSRVAVGSRMMDVLKAYGTPTERQKVAEEAAETKDRVLYITSDSYYRISYNRLGLCFWFSPQRRVTQIGVFKPLPNRKIRVEPQKEGLQ